MSFSENFNVRAAFSILDAQYGNFSNAAILAPCTNIPVSGPCNTIGTPTLTGNTTIAFDASGQGMVRAPNFTASVTANGNVDIAGGQLDVSSTLYYSSRLNFTFDHRVHQPNYLTLDARIAWSPNNSGFTIAAFGRNLTDQTVISGTFIADPADGVSYAPPRTYGVAVEYRF
jgi:iron complex outermembrane receptor protein